MVEKIKVLKHHATTIDINGICSKGIEGVPIMITNYMKNHIDGHGAYIFLNEWQRQKFVEAIEEAAIAICRNNYELVPDFKDPGETTRNADGICSNCPNFTLAGDVFSCKAEEKYDEMFVKKNKSNS